MFIVFEGADGVGKTTLLETTELMLRKRIEDLALDYTIVRVKYPGQTPFGLKIREFLLNDPDSADLNGVTKGALMAADFRLTQDSLAQQFRNNKIIVLADRFFFSTLAYNLWARLENAQSHMIEDCFNGSGFFTGIKKPDITYYVTANPDVRNARLAERGKKDNMETETENVDLAKRYEIIFERVNKIFNVVTLDNSYVPKLHENASRICDDIIKAMKD